MSDQLATLVAQLKERRALTFQERIKSLDIRDDIWRKCMASSCIIYRSIHFLL